MKKTTLLSLFLSCLSVKAAPPVLMATTNNTHALVVSFSAVSGFTTNQMLVDGLVNVINPINREPGSGIGSILGADVLTTTNITMELPNGAASSLLVTPNGFRVGVGNWTFGDSTLVTNRSSQFWSSIGDPATNFVTVGGHAKFADVGFTNRTIGMLTATIRVGTGDPENVVTATKGSLFLRTDGGGGTCFYVKESDTGSTGWVAK